MKYKLIITFDKEYEGYVVDVPELFGCMSQGKTMDEALQNIREAIPLWLESDTKNSSHFQQHLGDMFIGELTV